MSEILDRIQAKLRGEIGPAPPHLTIVVERSRFAAERASMIARHVDPTTVLVVVDRRLVRDRRRHRSMLEAGRRKEQRRSLVSPFAFTVKVAVS